MPKLYNANLVCGVSDGPAIWSWALARVGDNERTTTHWLNISVPAHLRPGLDAQLFVTFSWPLSGFLVMTFKIFKRRMIVCLPD